MAIPEALERAIAATGYTLDREESYPLDEKRVRIVVTSPNQHYVAFWLTEPTDNVDYSDYARALKYSLDRVQDHSGGRDCTRCREDTPQP